MLSQSKSVAPIDLRLEDRVKFWSEKTSYMVRSLSKDFVILTKPAPFKESGTLQWYCILDWARGWRGPQISYGLGAETEEDIQEMQEALDARETELSRRHSMPIDIEWVHSPRRYFVKNEEII